MKFKVNGLKWTLLNLKPEDERLKIRNNSCFGVTSYHDLMVYMDITQAKELYRQTVIHELIHVFTFSFGVHLIANNDTEEPVCDFIGAHFDEIRAIADKVMKLYAKGGDK